MRFALSAEQQGLQDSLRAFLDKHATSAAVRTSVLTPGGHDVNLWRRLADDLGVFAIGVPEEHGGLGGSFVDVAVVLEEIGRHVVPGPFLSTAVLSVRLLLESGDEQACKKWLPRLAEGHTWATAALAEDDGAWAGRPGSTTATATADGGWHLHGAKAFVMDAHTADLLIVLAEGPDGSDLYLAERGADGLTVIREPTLDSTRPLSRVTLEGVPAERLGGAGQGQQTAERALQVAVVGLACEQVGGAAYCLESAVAYAKARVQFDRPIGSFQAIKHMLADRLIDNESASAAAYYAAWAVDATRDELPVLASLCKAFCSDAYVDAATTNVQVHGGIGFTWEHDAHLYLKRTHSSKQLLGSPTHHREVLAGRVLDGASDRM